MNKAERIKYKVDYRKAARRSILYPFLRRMLFYHVASHVWLQGLGNAYAFGGLEIF